MFYNNDVVELNTVAKKCMIHRVKHSELPNRHVLQYVISPPF